MAKSLNKNLVLTMIKTIASVLFPLITFPYATRTLSASGVGEYNFAHSLVSYFSLIASLGIGTYAIREGAKRREDREDISAFASEMLTLNLVFTVVAYIALVVCFALFQEFRAHSIAIGIFSTSIIFTVLGVDWLFSIYEDYWYITVRSLVFQIISVIALFLFVRSEKDVYWYIAINVIANVGSNIFNFFYAKKYVTFKLVLNKKIFDHLKSVFIIFSTTLATMIYVNADQTMLGWMRGTTEVGYYAVASKLYSILKSVLNSLVPVFMARLSYNFAYNKDEYNKLFRYANNLLIMFTVPIAIGSLFFSQDIILVLSGDKYLAAEAGMKLLMLSMMFATLGNLFSSGGLLPAKKEKIMFGATMTGAVINVVANSMLIPYWGCTGAAFATLVTEMTIFGVLFISFIRFVKTPLGIEHLIKCMVSASSFLLVNLSRNFLRFESEWAGLGCIVICIILYFALLLILKDEIVTYFYAKAVHMLKKRCKH